MPCAEFRTLQGKKKKGKEEITRDGPPAPRFPPYNRRTRGKKGEKKKKKKERGKHGRQRLSAIFVHRRI